MIAADILIFNIDLLATCAGPGPRRGAAQREIGAIPNAAIAGMDGRIVWIGPTSEWQQHVAVLRGVEEIDARGCTVVPGFVDPHTHLIFAGDRRDDLPHRLARATYS